MSFPLELKNPRAGGLIPGRCIQLELGLLYLDLPRAVEGGPPGWAGTPLDRQPAPVHYVQKDLAARGESPTARRWE